MKPPVPQALLFCLLKVVNIECLSRSSYLIMYPVNIYVLVAGWVFQIGVGGD